MSQMRDIDRLLAADEANVRTMRTIFSDYSPELTEFLNTASELYATSCRAFGQALSDETVNIAADDSSVGKIQAKLQRGLLLARIGVLCSTAITDFLRMRLTLPLACVRLQCESLGLTRLMFENFRVAQRWMSIQTDKDGKDFFNRYQKRLKSILETYHLADVYDHTSGAALHSRFIGLARGYRTANRNDGQIVTQSSIILAQEFDQENPDYFMVQVFYFLDVQARIFASLKDAAPEIDDPLLLETRIPTFIERENRLFRNFKESFARRHPRSSA